MTSPTVTEVLAEHQRTLAPGGACRCGTWPPAARDVDYPTHVEAMLRAAGLLAEDGETVTEWAVRWSPEHELTTDHAVYRDVFKWTEEEVKRVQKSMRTATAFSRQRTTYPDRVTLWTEVTE